MWLGEAEGREHLFGFYGQPGTRAFKIMVRGKRYKYIFLANGGRELLFDLTEDPHEISDLSAAKPDVLAGLRAVAERECARTNIDRALEGGKLTRLPYEAKERFRIHQFETSRAPGDFPDDPKDVYDTVGW